MENRPSTMWQVQAYKRCSDGLSVEHSPQDFGDANTMSHLSKTAASVEWS